MTQPDPKEPSAAPPFSVASAVVETTVSFRCHTSPPCSITHYKIGLSGKEYRGPLQIDVGKLSWRSTRSVHGRNTARNNLERISSNLDRNKP